MNVGEGGLVVGGEMQPSFQHSRKSRRKSNSRLCPRPVDIADIRARCGKFKVYFPMHSVTATRRGRLWLVSSGLLEAHPSSIAGQSISISASPSRFDCPYNAYSRPNDLIEHCR